MHHLCTLVPFQLMLLYTLSLSLIRVIHQFFPGLQLPALYVPFNSDGGLPLGPAGDLDPRLPFHRPFGHVLSETFFPGVDAVLTSTMLSHFLAMGAM